MTYGAVLKIYWFVGADSWAVSEDGALSLSWSVTAGCSALTGAHSACKLDVREQQQMTNSSVPLLSLFAVPSVSETSPDCYFVLSRFALTRYSFVLKGAEQVQCGSKVPWLRRCVLQFWSSSPHYSPKLRHSMIKLQILQSLKLAELLPLLSYVSVLPRLWKVKTCWLTMKFSSLWWVDPD